MAPATENLCGNGSITGAAGVVTRNLHLLQLGLKQDFAERGFE